VVFIPKYRRKVVYRELRQYLGEAFRKLALQKESRIEQGHFMRYHVSHPNSRFERPHL
jgi:putative transposase